jgi:hypothetical protein
MGRFFADGQLHFAHCLSVFIPHQPALSRPTIEMAEAFDIPITITYALGFPLVLAAVFLFGTGILAFFVDREKSDPRKAWMARTSQKHKKTTPSSKNPIRSQKNHVR